MSIFTYSVSFVSNNLTPPKLRSSILLAWLNVIGFPLQWVTNRLNDYIYGTDLLNEWDVAVTYNIGSDPVIWTDSRVYQCILDGALGATKQPTGAALSSTYWREVLPNWIGTDERIKYNSQIIMLEFELNKIFFNASAVDQIFLNNNNTGNQMLMANTSPYSSTMSNAGQWSTSFMGNTYNPSQYNFTVNVPIALFNTLGTTVQDRENAIRNVVDKYRIPGINYNVTTY